MPPDEPKRETVIALRAARDCRRLATTVLLDRLDRLGTVDCASCGRPVAVATDADHPVHDFEGRVLCRICVRAARVAKECAREERRRGEPAAPTADEYARQVEEWVRQGWTVHLTPAPDPRPTLGEWVRRAYRREQSPK